MLVLKSILPPKAILLIMFLFDMYKGMLRLKFSLQQPNYLQLVEQTSNLGAVPPSFNCQYACLLQTIFLTGTASQRSKKNGTH